MRTNLPVTNAEYVLKDSDTIVSKTDLRGNITYVNQDFVRISGFTEEELLGAPQNIVRHPDMPPEAFADFWRTLQSGKAWTGLVKNRSKSGDHYWVEANAAPLLENGRMVGYTSIRIKPSRAQVAAAEQAYREIRNGSAALAVREGTVVRRSPLGRLGALGQLSLRATTMLACGLPASLFGTVLLAAWLDDGTALTAGAATLGMVASLLGMLLLHRAVAPLQRMRADIEHMSAGDLTGRIDASGSSDVSALAQALRILQINVKLLVGQIKEATDVVARGATEIAAGNADLSARTESQASALEIGRAHV